MSEIVLNEKPEWTYKDPGSINLDEVDLINPYLFHDDYHVALFERLRNESPVHLQEHHEEVGSFWNVTRYEDIMAVDTDHETFSSDGSIVVDDSDEEYNDGLTDTCWNSGACSSKHERSTSKIPSR